MTKSERWSKTVDGWRIFPRLFITVYMYLVVTSSHWFMALEDPSAPQSAFMAAIIGAGAAWFGLYVGTRNDGNK